MVGPRIQQLDLEHGGTVTGRYFIDATYEGDLFATAGCSYRVGREPVAEFDESCNGVQFRDEHQFVVDVDPYVTPGDPRSGLLPEISREPEAGRPGARDTKLQAFNFRMQLSNGPDHVPFPKPAGYDPGRYALLARFIAAAADTPWDFSYPKGPLHLAAGDSNNRGAFSTDFIGGNYRWADGSYEPGAHAASLPIRRGLAVPLPELYRLREAIIQEHVTYQQGLGAGLSVGHAYRLRLDPHGARIHDPRPVGRHRGVARHPGWACRAGCRVRRAPSAVGGRWTGARVGSLSRAAASCVAAHFCSRSKLHSFGPTFSSAVSPLLLAEL
jgi:hypothetical protein